MGPKFVAAVVLCFVGFIGLARGKNEHPLDKLEPAPANEQIPILDFFRAALFSDKFDRTSLLVCNLATSKFEMLISQKNTDIHSYHWLGEKNLLLRMTREKLYALGMSVAPVDNLTSAYLIEAFNALNVVGVPHRDPLKPLLWLRNNAWDNGRDYGVMKIDARQKLKPRKDGLSGLDSSEYPYGTAASVLKAYDAPPGGKAAGYFADNQGELAFAYTEQDGLFTLHRLESKGWTPCPVDLDAVGVLGAGDIPGEIIVVGPRVEGKPRALHRMDAATGQLGEILYQDDRYDLDSVRLYRHPVTQKIIGLQYARTAPHTAWLTDEYKALQKRISASFPTPNMILRIVGSDRAEKRFVVAATNDRTPTAYYQIDLEKGQLGLLKSTAPWIDPQRMRPMQTMSYKSRDGFRIEGYFTLPEGASKETPAPLVVLPHGGPRARDHWTFDAEVQFLASRGYAVFQPNYRGSTTYQWQFPESARWDFRRMHDDVTDGVKALIKTGLVDPRRIAIMGGSFGGYLALSGAAHERDLYRCAVTLAGVFDWEQVIRESKGDEHSRSEYNILRRHLGDPRKQAEFFEEISPLRHVSGIKIPVFIAHGKDDPVAQVSQSRRLVSELEKHGVPHEKRFVGGEGHGFAYYKNRVEIYGAVETFLGKHLAPLPATTAVSSAAP